MNRAAAPATTCGIFVYYRVDTAVVPRIVADVVRQQAERAPPARLDGTGAVAAAPATFPKATVWVRDDGQTLMEIYEGAPMTVLDAIEQQIAEGLQRRGWQLTRMRERFERVTGVMDSVAG